MAGFEELLQAEREPKATNKSMRAIFFIFHHCSEFPAGRNTRSRSSFCREIRDVDSSAFGSRVPDSGLPTLDAFSARFRSSVDNTQ